MGVASEAGVGSKFVFSVESKRCDMPKVLPESPPIVIPARLQGIESEYSPVSTHSYEFPREQEVVSKPLEQEKKPAARRVL